MAVAILFVGTIPGSMSTPCDSAAHCSGRGSTFDQDNSDGCVCFCDPGYGGASCEITIAAPACPLYNETNSGGLLQGFEHYTSLGEQGRAWYELHGLRQQCEDEVNAGPPSCPPLSEFPPTK